MQKSQRCCHRITQKQLQMSMIKKHVKKDKYIYIYIYIYYIYIYIYPEERQKIIDYLRLI